MLGLAIPMLVGMLLMASVGLVDAYFIGRLGTPELAAFGLCFPFVSISQALFFGYTTGITSVVAQAMGRAGRSTPKAQERALLAYGMLGLAAIAAPLLAGAAWWHEALLSSGGASADITALAWQYFGPVLLAQALAVVPTSIMAALRGMGETRSTAQVMLAMSALNAALDPPLMFGWGPLPALGLSGAAWSTVAAHGWGVGHAAWLLRRKFRTVPARAARTSAWAMLKPILAISAPAMTGQALGPLAAAVETWLIARHGTVALAALGILQRVLLVVMMVPFATSAALMPLIGQSWGAGQPDRAAEALRTARRGLWVLGGGLGLGVALSAEWMAQAFSSDPAVVALASAGLFILPWRTVPTGTTVATIGAFNAIGRAARAPQLSSFYCFVLLPSLGYFGGVRYGPIGVFGGVAIAAWLNAGLATWLIRKEGLNVKLG